ncbi:MAG TPA: hypothetical protein VKK79_08895 [Candidatus Lokiarchaeia archaeon]|nr:hypothetical protein [Candidatus Lokiarchaeia archaeon]
MTIIIEPTGVNFLVYPSDRPGDVEIYRDVVKAIANAFRKKADGGVDAPPIVVAPLFASALR